MMPDFHFLTTHVGSVPHPDGSDLCTWLASRLDIPAWPQLPRRNFRESMYVQYTANLPGIKVNEVKEKVYFDTTQDLSPHLEEFYSHILDDEVDCFGLNPEYASGFFEMLKTLDGTDGKWAKGQVTGPISFGLTVTDQDLRASLYHDLLGDVIVKNAAMNARWQIRQLKKNRPYVVIFVDEPYLASFGSAFISLSREQVLSMLNEVFHAIHGEGAIAGVHCCANTDWGLLLSTEVDILNLDAFGYVENLALYPMELRSFMERKGSICWGIVPNNEEIRSFAPARLAERLKENMQMISSKAKGRDENILPEEFAARSLLSPACGLGSSTIELCEEVFEKLAETGDWLKRG